MSKLISELCVDMKNNIFDTCREVKLEVEDPANCIVYLDNVDYSLFETMDGDYYVFKGTAYILSSNSCKMDAGFLIDVTKNKKGSWSNEEGSDLVAIQGRTDKAYKISLDFNEYLLKKQFLGSKITDVEVKIESK